MKCPITRLIRTALYGNRVISNLKLIQIKKGVLWETCYETHRNKTNQIDLYGVIRKSLRRYMETVL